MSTEKMFLTILNRMDTMETGLNAKLDKLEERIGRLEVRMDKQESKVNTLESNMNMEFQAVRTEMEFVHKSLKKEIDILSDKVDRLLFTKDVEGYDKINVRIEVLEHGYRELREKIV